MRKFLLLLFISLAACSPQSEVSSWSWVFTTGESVQFPAEWLFAQGAFDLLTMKDSEGYFRASLGYYPNEEAIPQDEGFEESTIGDIVRLLRKEILMETPVDGVNESVIYLAIYPSLEVLSAHLPKTENIAERERLFREVVLSFEVPVGNKLGFSGGYAGVMSYSDDWEIVNWSLGDSPDLRSEETRLYILLVRRGFGLAFELSQEEIDALSHEELVLSLLNLYDPIPAIDESVLEVEDISATSIFTYHGDDTGISVFSVDGELWFRFGYTNSEPSDVADIREMIQSIIETYHLSDFYPHIFSQQLELTPESTEE